MVIALPMGIAATITRTMRFTVLNNRMDATVRRKLGDPARTSRAETHKIAEWVSKLTMSNPTHMAIVCIYGLYPIPGETRKRSVK